MVLVISSGLQKITFGFDRDGLDFAITLLAWLYTLGRGGEVGTGVWLGTWLGMGEGSNLGGRELKGNLSKLLVMEYLTWS